MKVIKAHAIKTENFLETRKKEKSDNLIWMGEGIK